MARLNVEDDWFTDDDGRRAALQKAVIERPRDPEAEADGLALRGWKLGQRYWKDGGKLIPKAVFERRGLAALLTADLAVEQDDGIYVRGTSEKADWIRRKVEAGRAGGQQSAESRKAESGSAVPPGASNAPKQNRSTASAGASEKPKHSSSTAEAAPNPPAPALAPAPAPAPALEERECKSSADADPLPLDFKALWNANRGALAEVQVMTSKRRRHCNARLKEQPKAEYWEALFRRAAASPFLTGRNDRGWQVTFDWLIENDTNHVKVSEGKFDARQGVSSGSGRGDRDRGMIRGCDDEPNGGFIMAEDP